MGLRGLCCLMFIPPQQVKSNSCAKPEPQERLAGAGQRAASNNILPIDKQEVRIRNESEDERRFSGPSRRMSRSETSRAAVAEFLRSRSEQACFLSEVAAALGGREVEVETRLRELHNEGEAWLEEFVGPDPHLPARILVASAIDPKLPRGPARDAARTRTHRAFDAWFRECLMTHRCV